MFLFLSIWIALAHATPDNGKPILWQTTAAAATLTNGAIGGFLGADSKCSTGSAGPLTAVLSDGNGYFGESYNNLIQGKGDDYIIVRDIFGRPLTSIEDPIQVKNLNDYSVYEAYLGAIPDINGRMRNRVEFWTGIGGSSCSNWTTISGSGSLYAYFDPPGTTTQSCFVGGSLLCLKDLEPIDTIPRVLNTTYFAATDGLYDGDLGGETGADSICETEAGETGWKALLFYEPTVPFEYYPNQRTMIQNYATGAILDYFSSVSTFIYRFYRGQPDGFINQPVPTTFTGAVYTPGDIIGWIGSSGFSCNNWTDTASSGRYLLYAAVPGGTTNTLNSNPCANTYRLVCYSPLQETFVYPTRYTISSSTEKINGSTNAFESADAACATPDNPNLKAALFEASSLRPDILNETYPVQMVNIYNETLGGIIESELVMQANWTFSNAPFPASNGEMSDALTYWLGLSGPTCQSWSSDSSGETGIIYESESTLSNDTSSLCNNTHHVVCIGQLETAENRTSTPTPTPTPTPTTTSMTPTPTPTTTSMTPSLTPTPTTTSMTPTPTSTTTSMTPTPTSTTTSMTPTPTSTTTSMTPTPTPTITTSMVPTSTSTPTPTPTPTPTNVNQEALLSLYVVYIIIGIVMLLLTIVFVLR